MYFLKHYSAVEKICILICSTGMAFGTILNEKQMPWLWPNSLIEILFLLSWASYECCNWPLPNKDRLRTHSISYKRH